MALPDPHRQGPEGWAFDTAEGLDEIVVRRIGENELEAIEVCRAYLEAQAAYAAADRDADDVLEYAQRLRSTPGMKDGLYWEAARAKSRARSARSSPRTKATSKAGRQGAPYTATTSAS